MYAVLFYEILFQLLFLFLQKIMRKNENSEVQKTYAGTFWRNEMN